MKKKTDKVSVNEVMKIVEQTEGWLEPKEIENLYFEAERNITDNGIIVEIGSWICRDI